MVTTKYIDHGIAFVNFLEKKTTFLFENKICPKIIKNSFYDQSLKKKKNYEK